MTLRAELILTGDSGLQALATQAETAALRPTQMEHEIDWIAHSDHPARATAGVLALFRQDRLAAYVPLRYRWDGLVVKLAGKKLARLPYRNVQLFGAGVVCTDPELVPEAVAALRELPWRFDALNFWDLPVDSPLWQAIEGGAVDGYKRIERGRHPRHVIDLPETIDGYLERFSSKSRATLRRKARQLENDCGTLSLRTYRTHDDVPALMEAVEPVFLKTYHHHLLGEDLTSRNVRLAKKLACWADCGWLRSYVLFAGERPIAYLIGHLARRSLSYDHPGYDPNLSMQSPGLLLLLRIIEDLITSRDADVLDFGSGEADYKQQFATRSYQEVSALLVQPTAYARSVANLTRGIASASMLGARLLERHGFKARVLNWLRRRRLRVVPSPGKPSGE